MFSMLSVLQCFSGHEAPPSYSRRAWCAAQEGRAAVLTLIVAGEEYSAGQTRPVALAGLVRCTCCVPPKWTDCFTGAEKCAVNGRLASFLAAVLAGGNDEKVSLSFG